MHFLQGSSSCPGICSVALQSICGSGLFYEVGTLNLTLHVWIHFEQNQCTEQIEDAHIFSLFTGLFNASEK